MSRWVRIGFIVISAVLGLILASGIVIRWLDSGSLKDWLTASLEARTGRKVTIGRADFDLLRWFIFRPAVTLHDVSIGNPPGFSSGNLLEAKKVSARISLLPVLRRRVEVETLAIDRPHIMVESDERGHTNLEVFLRMVTARRQASGNKAAGAGNGATHDPPPKKEALFAINDLSANSGSLTYGGAKDVDLGDISVRLRGLCQDEPCQLRASAKLFGGKVSSLKIEGRIGPFGPDSLPLDGAMTVTLPLGEGPAPSAARRFAPLLAARGGKARATVESSIKGDVYQSFNRPSKLVLADIMISGPKDHLMPFSGQAPGSIKAVNLLTRPACKLDIPDASSEPRKVKW